MRKVGTNIQTIETWVRVGGEGESNGGTIFFKQGVIYSYGYHFPMAVVLPNGKFLVNGDRYSNTTSTKHQSPLFRAIPEYQRIEVPFSALAAMGNVSYGETPKMAKDINIIDREAERWEWTGKVKTNGDKVFEHTLGGALFEYLGNYYLTGMDPSGRDTRGRFFLTQLDNEAIQEHGVPENIDAAYKLMMPPLIRQLDGDAIIYRQGEWFFVEYLCGPPEETQKPYYLEHRDPDRENSHYATEGFRRGHDQYVKGIVKHVRREHKQLKLFQTGEKHKDRGWFRVFESVQGPSWGAAGGVD